VGTSQGVRVVSKLASGGLALQSFDSSGQQRLPAAPITLVPATVVGSGDSVFVAAAGRADRIWVMWLRSAEPTGGGLRSLLLQGFTADGLAVTPEFELASGLGSSVVGRMELVMNDQRVIASWTESLNTHRYAIVNNETGALLGVQSTAGAQAAMPFASSDHLGFATLNGAVWQLDSQYLPLIPSGSPAYLEDVIPAWAHPFGSDATPVTDANRLYLHGRQSTVLWPQEESFVGSVFELFELPLQQGRVSSTAQPKLLFRQPLASERFNATHLLVLEEGPLVIGYQSQTHQLFIHPVWRQ
jgi:hypothetical protein